MEAIAESGRIPKSRITCASPRQAPRAAGERLQGRPAGHKKLCMAAKPFDSAEGHARDQRQPHRWASIRGPCRLVQPRATLIPRSFAAPRRRKELAMASAQGSNPNGNQAIREAFTFDDVLLKPGLSDVL